ncbi:YycH family regulatory protein [Lactobacillus selangorensis]|nr:two-component system activity regulator YycH [Lactobacillus selangorensis]KRN32926.1 hypothetical protein IV40_GL000986 [Lactobacillus selangorensis]
MKINDILLRVGLTLAILLSFFLSWKIWTSSVRYEGSTNSSVTSSTTQTADTKNIDEVFSPTQIFMRNDGQKYLIYNTHDNMTSRFETEIKNWTFSQPRKLAKMSGKAYTKELARKNSLQFVYADNITVNLFESIFKKLKVPLRKNTTFNRMLITRKTGRTYLLLLNDKTRQGYQLRVAGISVQKVNQIIQTANVKLPVVEKMMNHLPLTYYQKTVDIKPYSYLASHQSENYFVSNLLDTSNPGSIDSKENNDETIYSDGVYQRLTVNHKTNQIQYDDYTSNKKITNVSDLLTNSYSELIKIGNPLTNMRYVNYDENAGTVTYRSYVEGFPIYYQTDFGAVKVKLSQSSTTLNFSAYSLQVPVPSTETAVHLPATQTMLNQLSAAGYKLNEISNIQIGYRWVKDADNEQIIDLQPSYYVQYQGEWSEYKDMLNNSQSQTKAG